MLFAALAPSVSAAVADGRFAPPTDVCGAADGRAASRGEAAAPSADGDSTLAAGLDACGYCLLGAHLAPPGTVLQPDFSCSAPTAPPQVLCGLPPADVAWTLQPSRAPPAPF